MTEMDSDHTSFSASQYEAARFIVARLRAEAAGERFEASDLGLKLSPAGDWPVAVLDDGTVILGTDYIRASLLLLWSLVQDLADSEEVDPGIVVSAVGLSLAEHEPS